jgi:hypothetical protein
MIVAVNIDHTASDPRCGRDEVSSSSASYNFIAARASGDFSPNARLGGGGHPARFGPTLASRRMKMSAAHDRLSARL